MYILLCGFFFVIVIITVLFFSGKLVLTTIFYIFAVAGQEPLQILSLHHDTPPFTLQAVSQNHPQLGVSVNHENLNEVSSTILMAEKWVRTHVLAHNPSTNITTIVVGPNLLCINKQDEDISKLLFRSMKNIHHTLTRWGLEKEIKVSVSLSSSCFLQDFTQSFINPILSFLEDINSTYSLPTHPSFPAVDLVNSHSNSMKKLGFLHINKLNLILHTPKHAIPTGRKLSFVESMPALPSEISPIPSNGRAETATSPLPPLVGITSPTPLVGPAIPPPYPYNLPPCNPYIGGGGSNGGGVAAAPPVVAGGHHHEGLWCVAKPSVPSDQLQEALDYACGEGGADCEAIGPSGSCYNPDSVVAHASYAFNSYWQKNKKNGGTCGFGGTAMLISSDPSKTSSLHFDCLILL